MKKLIEEDRKIIEKFQNGGFTTDNTYLEQVKTKSEYMHSDYKPR